MRKHLLAIVAASTLVLGSSAFAADLESNMFPVTNFIAALITGLVIGLAIGYVIILARKFTINQSNSTYGADVMMGAGNASGRFLGPLIILSAMTASIPIGIGSLAGALLFYLWQKPITGGAILGAMILGWLFPVAL
jgi:hypothetical protein